MLLLRCAIVSLVVCTSRAFTGYTRGHCQPVPQFCRNLTNGNEYALMRVPNELNNFQLNETVEGIKHWQPLVGQCHAGLKLFLCTIYAPICVHDEKHDQLVKIRNCRSFCLRVKASCEPVLNDHNYPWPTHDAFNCSLHKDDSMCVREDFVVAATTRPPVVYEDKDVACSPNLNTAKVLRAKACNSHLAFRAEVTSVRELKGLFALIRFKKHKKSGKQRSTRNSRKALKKATDNFDRALIPKKSCRNLSRLRVNEPYLIIVDKKQGKKTVRYIVKAIVPWNKRHRKLTKKSNVCKES